MCKFFGKKKTDPGVVILKQTKPGTCGGTDATQDTRAPKEIRSEDMTLFSVESSMGFVNQPDECPGYVHAFAAPAGGGAFLFYKVSSHPFDRRETPFTWAYVEGSVFPELVSLVRECGLAEKNGFHSRTHGLPEDFGGSVDIRYASGERISYSDNQSPILIIPSAIRIRETFERFLTFAKIPLPEGSELREVHFREDRKERGYTDAVLTFRPDGTGVNKKQAKYEDPKVYESEKEVDEETVALVKRRISECGMFAWEHLPVQPDPLGRDRKLTFVFENGREITVAGNPDLPDEIGRGFFDIELEMTTKH